MTSETVAKKNIQKLQRAIVEGLEDVKAQDIQVFNTEHLSPLFERVVVASGTSNRQTKALAASVRDAVREAGFDKPRTEGEENGEWIIVDCGAAVVHVMQPGIRQYYQLEGIWGDKPVRLKHAAADKAREAPARATSRTSKTAKPSKTPVAAKTVAQVIAKTAARPSVKPAAKKTTAGTTTRGAAKKTAKSTASSAVKASVKTASKVAAKTSAKPPTQAPAKPKARVATVVVNKPKPKAKAPVAAKSTAAAKTARSAAPAKSTKAKAPARKTSA
jgi:ribosome-associated protein